LRAHQSRTTLRSTDMPGAQSDKKASTVIIMGHPFSFRLSGAFTESLLDELMTN